MKLPCYEIVMSIFVEVVMSNGKLCNILKFFIGIFDQIETGEKFSTELKYNKATSIQQLIFFKNLAMKL